MSKSKITIKMIKKKNPARHGTGVWRTAGMILLFLLPLLLGCPLYDASFGDVADRIYRVYYEGNRHTEGSPPVDPAAYSPGDKATVLAKPEGLKRGTLPFGGWRQIGSNNIFQAGDAIYIGYEDVLFYAWWQDDPNYVPYQYADHSDTGGVIITQYAPYDENYMGALTIPDKLDGKAVTAIGEGVFANRYFDSITLPSQLKAIGNKAFARTYITNITIPDTVTSIGKLAFQDAALETISLGSGLKSIGDYAFDGNRLTGLFLPASVTSVGAGAFFGNELRSIEIGANVAIESDTSMGIHGASFYNHYQDQGAKAGVYLYKGQAWKGPYAD
ncbi:MAG: leucine-rich repeat domain-containing protein [Treponema sp.]|jgi:hypothetical protein|nr:leucine-rich repeat domain-containing protein [Treponema sp.]